MQIAVIGAGSWGSAIAWVLATNEHRVNLWARNSEIAQAINKVHKNPRYISSVNLPAKITATSDLSEALLGVDAIVLATPSSAVRQTARELAVCLEKRSVSGLDSVKPILLLTKGLEISDSKVPPKLLLDVLAEELECKEQLAVLSGPNHAEEVALGMLAGTVIAANNRCVAELFQQLLALPSFRVYTSEDCIGVQLCGAAKNVIAIAAGMAAGIGLGDNLAAMLMTRGLAEISRLVIACGGEQQTCMGLAGMGDLIVTCSSRHSRNRSFGEALAKGVTLSEYEANTHMVVEGARACRALPALAKSKHVEMPIIEHVQHVVWDEHPIHDVLESLLERPAKPEF